jgi:hypothetical protein
MPMSKVVARIIIGLLKTESGLLCFCVIAIFSNQIFCSPTVHVVPKLLVFFSPIAYFCGQWLDINKIILSVLAGVYL